MTGKARTVRRRAVAMAASIVLAGLVGGCVGDDESAELPMGPLVIAGGGTTGVYYSYGEQLAEVLSDRLAHPVKVIETSGSVENLELVTEGSADVGFSAADAASDAAVGRGPFPDPLPVQAIARIYDDFIHLIVNADSPIRDIGDLYGRVVSLGAMGSGTELIADRLLQAAGMNVRDVENAGLGIDDSIEALQDGRIEAFFWSGGVPTPGVDDLSERIPIRLIDVSALVGTMSQTYGGGYRRGVIPGSSYGLTSDVATLAVPNLLVVRFDADDRLVYEIAEALFEQRSAMAAVVPAAAQLDRPRVIFTEPVVLHPGAIEYYRDTKM